MPLFPLPTDTYTAPPRPFTPSPDPRYKPPLFPLVDAPVLNMIKPLTPDVPALLVRNSNAPLDIALPYPLINDTRPPDFDGYVVVPAIITISPPVPLLPEPTLTYTAPPRPLLDTPDPIYSAPVFPDPEVPVLNINIPLTPLLTASPVLNTKSPELLPSTFEPV